MVTLTACPPPDQLHAFSSGTLPSADSEAVFAHLQDCPQCQSELETISDREDSLIASLREGENAGDWQHEPGCQRAVAESLAVWAAATAGGTLTADALPLSIGEYEILRPLGRGGMGQVFLAQHTKLGRRVAVKVLASHRLADRRSRERFDAEMRAVGRLSHPHIVTAHDAREIDGRAVLVTEYIDGLDLGQVLQRTGALSTADACEIVRRVAVALEYTHNQGFIHRDVKPSNVMLSCTGEVKLLDLGLARLQADLAGEHAEITATGQAMGTADYVAPEQVTDSRSVDIRADIYALGCTLYKLLTGHAPFADGQHETPFAKMTAHVSTPPPKLICSVEGVPAALEKLVESMLAKEPGARPQTPQQVADALARFATGNDLPALIERAQAASPAPQSRSAAVSHTPAPPVGWMRRPAPRWALVATGLAALLLGVVLGAMGVLIKIRYPDGTVAEVRAPAGSQVAVEYEAENGSKPAGGMSMGMGMGMGMGMERLSEPSSDVMHDLFSVDHGNAGLDGVQAKATAIIPQSHITSGEAEAAAVHSKKRLKKIGLAFANFHDAYERFPSSQNHTAIRGGGPGGGETGPAYSWRVAILPFIGHADLYEQYRFDEPWDSEHNRQLLDQMPDVYRSSFTADDQQATHTNFLGFATEQGVLGTGKGTRYRDIFDGTANTVLVVEGRKRVPWTKPEDYSEVDVENLAPAMVEQGSQPLHIVLVYGSVRTLDMADATHRKQLQQAITKAGNEVIQGW